MKRPSARVLRITAVATLIGFSVLVVASFGTRLTPYLRDRIMDALNLRFKSQVTVDALQVAVVPAPTVSGEGLALRHNGRTDVPPLIQIKSFSGTAGVWGLYRSPLHLSTVELEGLQINVPPGGLKVGDDTAPGAGPLRRNRRKPLSLIIDRITSREARLELIPRDAGKLPRVFEIHDLTMENFRPDQPATFTASLTNPKPRGRIDTKGSFGPWSADEPDRTALNGEFVFDNANLDTIKGLGGILSSTGSYAGVLGRIDVHGQTTTPDFQLDIAGRPVPLTTKYHAIVDGTNGDTFLEQVDAVLAKTAISAKGAIVRARDVKGRHISVDVEIAKGRLEDLLSLAVKNTKPPITGQITLHSSVVIPAGEQKVLEKLQLNGQFKLSQARFTNFDIQQRINTLSRRGKGDESEAPTGAAVVSNLGGRFVLRNGTMTLSDLAFAVPGAVVQLAGTYGLRGGEMDFSGFLLLDASLADTTSGWRSMAARIVQPFFRRPGGGSKIPIKISGTRENPSFGLDTRKAFLPG